MPHIKITPSQTTAIHGDETIPPNELLEALARLMTRTLRRLTTEKNSTSARNAWINAQGYIEQSLDTPPRLYGGVVVRDD